MSNSSPSRDRLIPLLDSVVARYGGIEHLDSDPLIKVVPYQAPLDREIAAFIAAVLSFGNVKAILGGIDQALGPLGPRPSERLASWSDRRAMEGARGFRYRWIHDQDLGGLYVSLGSALREEGGLEPLFERGVGERDEDVRGGAMTLTMGLRSRLPDQVQTRRGARFLLADPSGAGASKRLHMFLRWMIRQEAPDLGLWRAARPSQLLMPLDTHVARIARYIGLTDREQADKRTVLQVTRALRAIDPEDPTRFDFALARLGILGQCPHRRDPVRCAPCDLVSACTL